MNISRGGIVVESALKKALDEGRIGFAALDVRSPEPPDPANDILTGMPNVLLTQHIAASSIESWPITPRPPPRRSPSSKAGRLATADILCSGPPSPSDARFGIAAVRGRVWAASARGSPGVPSDRRWRAVGRLAVPLVHRACQATPNCANTARRAVRWHAGCAMPRTLARRRPCGRSVGTPGVPSDRGRPAVDPASSPLARRMCQVTGGGNGEPGEPPAPSPASSGPRPTGTARPRVARPRAARPSIRRSCGGPASRGSARPCPGAASPR